MGRHLNYSGLVIAGIGFFLTRFTVTLAIYQDPARFYLAGVAPMVLGLGLAAFGMALTVADVDPQLVRTTAIWCVIGAGTMFVLVLLTLLGSTPDQMLDLATLRSRTYLSNFLIGGSVGGTLTGLYAARNRREREAVRHQANRLEVLNRMLRHEVLNALTAIRGFAGVRESQDYDPETVIHDRADSIESTIEEVRYLTRSARTSENWGVAIDVSEHLDASVSAMSEAHPEADISIEAPDDAVRVVANDRLELVFTQLLENAIVHAAGEEGAAGGGDDPATESGPAVNVRVTPSEDRVRVSVVDEGIGLPDAQCRLLETGDIGRFDDPRSGYGLNVVRLLVESYDGTIETVVDDGGSTITISLPRAVVEGAGGSPSRASLTAVRPAVPQLVVTLLAALGAGVVYGAVSEFMGGSVAGIGVFYGTADPVVGWLTHEFHSVVFGFVYVSLLSLVPYRHRGRSLTYLGVGLAWALVLWLVAAGVIAPIWLQLSGIPASLPNVSVDLLVSHVAWGLSLGVFTALGYRYGVPLVGRLEERIT